MKCTVFSYIKHKKKSIILCTIFILIFAVVLFLYGAPTDPVLYAMLLSFCISVVFVVYDYLHYKKKHEDLKFLKNQIPSGLGKLPTPKSLIEEDYQAIITALSDEKLEVASRMDLMQTEMYDYYTLWAHQIKTPIAAMRLLLQSEESEANKELLLELFKIEQYVEMVLGYLRIEQASSDLVLKRYKLADIVKQAIRKYASVFIRKNIALEFIEMDNLVLTDEKWLVFVLEQLLSNALKYTRQGKIKIYMEENEEQVLVIEDTGIGIAKEDLPRVFEKGFTGYNGRMDKKATGIGLYLCKKVLNKLSHRITISSTIGTGTKVKINLSVANISIE